MIQSKDEEKIQSTVHSLITIGEPKQYYVVMHNDDSTPFDFVVDVLMDLFSHDNDTAADLAHKIHTDEKAIVGIIIVTEQIYKHFNNKVEGRGIIVVHNNIVLLWFANCH